MKTIRNISKQEAIKIAVGLGYTHVKVEGGRGDKREYKLRFRHANDLRTGLVYYREARQLNQWQHGFDFGTHEIHKTYSRITLEQEEPT
jgi:hypothetical protein